jgi:hypothetical protein
MALRVMPTVGAEVTVEHLGTTVAGVVQSVESGGRHVQVATEDGRVATFTLNGATARFTEDGVLTGARLRFTEP